MTNGAITAAAMLIEAAKAVGPIVVVEPRQFLVILGKVEKPLVVHSPSGLMTKKKYLTSYKGLIFFTKSKDELLIPASAELIMAKKISIPDI